MKKNEIIMIFVLFMVLIIGGFTLELFNIKNNNLIIKNRKNYEIFDNCYLIKENYYCEKTK